MKNRFVNGILSPNLWVVVLSGLAVVGLLFLATGHRKVGLWFLLPLLTGGLILIVLVIPILIRANAKLRHRRPGDKGKKKE